MFLMQRCSLLRDFGAKRPRHLDESYFAELFLRYFIERVPAVVTNKNQRTIREFSFLRKTSATCPQRKILDAAELIRMCVFEVAQDRQELQSFVTFFFDRVIEQAEGLRRFIRRINSAVFA